MIKFDQELVRASEIISLFLRINMNAQRNLPIRSSEMGVLILLVRSAQPKTPLQISEFFMISKPATTAIINSLLGDGFLTKEASTTDRRSFYLTPTEKARQLVEETFEIYHKNLAALMSGMGQENFREMIKLLESANQFLSKQ